MQIVQNATNIIPGTTQIVQLRVQSRNFISHSSWHKTRQSPRPATKISMGPKIERTKKTKTNLRCVYHQGQHNVRALGQDVFEEREKERDCLLLRMSEYVCLSMRVKEKQSSESVMRQQKKKIIWKQWKIYKKRKYWVPKDTMGKENKRTM